MAAGQAARGRSPGRAAQAGFAAVDALVGLMILAATLALSFNAMGSIGRLATAATETRQASALLAAVLETGPVTPGETSGQNSQFTWRIAVAPTHSPVPIPSVDVCSRLATAQSRASRKTYVLSTFAVCHTDGAA